MENPKLKQATLDTAASLPVMESFYTIQGEGYHQGKAAYFIRLAGCDVGCPWCDVKESWNAEEHEIVFLKDLKEELLESNAQTVVVTGGEPAMYDLNEITAMIRSLGMKTHIETSGAYPITGDWDWICVSPKRYKRALEDSLYRADELKVIIAHKNDFRFAEKHAELVSETCKLYIQPEWSNMEEMMPEIISFVKANPQFEISLQVHKYLNIP
jgi:organic radical activating enzyme